MNGADIVVSFVKSKLFQAPKDGSVQCADVDDHDEDNDNDDDDDDDDDDDNDNKILLAQELEAVD